MATADENNRPTPPKKKKKNETEQSEPFLQVNRLKSQYFKQFTEICLTEGVKFQIQAHIYENELDFYNILAKHSDKRFLEWVVYLVKTKVRPDSMNFIVGG